MKIVMDISEDTYKAIIEMKSLSIGRQSGKTILFSFLNEIQNSRPLPLPKGHGRLIDADELKEQIRRSLAIKSLDYLLPSEKAIVEQIDHTATIIQEDKEN